MPLAALRTSLALHGDTMGWNSARPAGSCPLFSCGLGKKQLQTHIYSSAPFLQQEELILCRGVDFEQVQV